VGEGVGEEVVAVVVAAVVFTGKAAAMANFAASAEEACDGEEISDNRRHLPESVSVNSVILVSFWLSHW